ncbi:sigma-70 family RNA polymerase sigma factor [Actinomadura sp. B10D3]|uniref:RNA polymerase sigma factor n=1 Tax=Actinomadura sp. B10D3 TaxID=3153557 RepID=UPI00325E4027
MDDHLLVEALRERAPAATAAMYDAHADRLYAYCWFQLRCREAARVALRDTFVVAEAHIGKLRDADRFGPWLYSIARLECARRLPQSHQTPDVPVASHDQEDVDQRITAWQAVLALKSVSREILELRVRHRLSVPDLAAVLGMSGKGAQAALDRAHDELHEALTAEILAQTGPYGCAERARLLRQRRGDLTPDISRRLVEHAEDCSACAAFRPRAVSAAKVYGLLPQAKPAPELRLRVMSCFMDPELVGYRLFVATRVTKFTSDGFPVQSVGSGGVVRTSRLGGRGWYARFRRTSSDGTAANLRGQAVRAAAVLAVVALLSGGGVASMYGLIGPGNKDAGTSAGPHPTVVPGVSRAPLPQDPDERPDGAGPIGVAPVSATFPLGARASSAPPTAFPVPSSALVSSYEASGPGATGALVVSPLYLDLAGSSDGAVELRAEGGPVAWKAASRGSLTASPSSGRLEAGQSVVVQVHVLRRDDSQGEGVITFTPGNCQVHVTWRPDAPDPDPTPSPTPTGSDPPSSSTPPETQRAGGPAPTTPAPAPSGPPPTEAEPTPSPTTPSTPEPSAGNDTASPTPSG